MKAVNKVLTVILCFQFGIAVPAVSSAPSGAAEMPAAAGQALTVLRELGIMPADADCEKNVSRQEFARFMTGFLNLSALPYQPEGGQRVFSDVGEGHPYIAYIEGVYYLGLMQGYKDGSFGPEDEITLLQSVKVIVCALGYAELAEQKGGYPFGYISVANSVGMLKGGTAAEERPVTCEQLADILYRSLDINILQVRRVFNGILDMKALSGQTVLSEYFSIVKAKGVITAAGRLSLAGESAAKDGSIMLDGRLIKTDQEVPLDYLGLSADAYIKTKPYEKLVFAIPRRENSVLEVDGGSIFSAEANQITFRRQEGALSTAVLKAGAYIVLNGLCYEGSVKDIIPDEGYVRLIDNNGDGIYEAAMVFAHVNYVVKAVNMQEGIITDRYRQPPINTGRSGTYTRVFYGREEVGLADIKKDDVLSVYAGKMKLDSEYGLTVDEESELYIIHIIRSVLGGVVDAVTPEGIEIDGQFCEVSQSYTSAAASKKAQPLLPGSQGSFHTDISGRIAAFNPGGGIWDDVAYLYGYLADCRVQAGISGILQFRILSQDNRVNVFDGAKRITLDGAPALSSQVMQIMDGTVGRHKHMLIRYELNNEGTIKTIDTEYYNAALETDDSLRKDYSTKNSGGSYGQVYYSSWGKTFGDSSFKGTEDTLVFVVPVVNSATEEAPDYTVDESALYHDGDFTVESLGFFGLETTIRPGGELSQYLDVYNLSKEKFSGAMVAYSLPTGKGAQASPGGRLAVVQKVSSVLSSDGGSVPKIYAWTTGASQISELVFSGSDAAGLSAAYQVRKGDIIRYDVNSAGYVGSLTVAFRFHDSIGGVADRSQLYKGFGRGGAALPGSAENSGNLIYYGQVRTMGENAIVLYTNNQEPIEQGERFHHNTVTFLTKNLISGGRIVVYDEARETGRKGTVEDVFDFGSAGGGSGGSLVYARCDSGYVNDLIVYRLK